MVNDVVIAGGIIFVFVSVGFILPFVQEMSEDEITYSGGNLEQDVGDGLSEPPSVNLVTGTTNLFDVIWSVAKMFFWTFGALPLWLDSIFLVLRVTLALIIARNIWIGGGA